jgi:hypothetical protein
MKANESPEKIYLYPYSTDGIYEVETKPLEGTIEYIRADAFMKKAETYLKEQFVNDVSVLASGVVHINFETAINNFKNYMKGE